MREGMLASCSAQVYRRKLILKAKSESGSYYLSFKRLVPGGFNMGLIGSACTALPSGTLRTRPTAQSRPRNPPPGAHTRSG